MPIDVRIADLLSRVTLRTKVGTILHASLPSGDPIPGRCDYHLPAMPDELGR